LSLLESTYMHIGSYSWLHKAR